MIWISEGALHQRVVEMTARFARLGETTVRDEGGATDYRWLQWVAVCPYPEMELARFQYDESYERSGGGWQMVKYAYDFLELTRRSRVALHNHLLTGPTAVPHAHCEPKVGNPEHDHYRFVELTIQEAIEEHLRWWASETELTCERLWPLAEIG